MTNECAFCNHPRGELISVRDEGNYVVTGRTTFEMACEGCRWKYGLREAKTMGYYDDAHNPELILQTIHSDTLIKAAKGEIDLNQLARQELANRGLNLEGRWVGFDRAGRQVMMSVPESEK